MPRIRKTEIETAVSYLEDAILAAQMEGATFPADGEFPFSPTSLAFSADVKARTAHYREVWIIAPLQFALGILNDELGRDRDHPLLLGPARERPELSEEQKAEIARINDELREANARKAGPGPREG